MARDFLTCKDSIQPNPNKIKRNNLNKHPSKENGPSLEAAAIVNHICIVISYICKNILKGQNVRRSIHIHTRNRDELELELE